MQTNESAAALAIYQREQLDKLVVVARSMVRRRVLETELLTHAIESVLPSSVMKPAWTAPGEASPASLVGHHLKRIVESFGGLLPGHTAICCCAKCRSAVAE